MPEVVIADTSCLIAFDTIGELDILHSVYEQISITPEIADEYPLPEWIKVETPVDKKYQRFLDTQVDRGEASAIALAAEKKDSLLILDDLKARKLAKRLDFTLTGTLGVIHKAKVDGIIQEILPIINKLRNTDFRISEEVIDQLLKKNDE
jgi:predicted nucleic acid-binding protein